MRIGCRVVGPEDVGRWDAEFLQVSLYRGMPGGRECMMQTVGECVRKGIPYVLHPVMYPLLDPNSFELLAEVAPHAGEALILHDERSPRDGGRIAGQEEEELRAALGQLRSVARVSLENAVATADAPWFWSSFASSVTIDIGHIEAAGLDSRAFVSALDDRLVGMVEYVHMHRNGTFRSGLTDHWPLEPGCAELRALELLIARKPDVSVVIEINEVEEMERSIALLCALRQPRPLRGGLHGVE